MRRSPPVRNGGSWLRCPHTRQSSGDGPVRCHLPARIRVRLRDRWRTGTLAFRLEQLSDARAARGACHTHLALSSDGRWLRQPLQRQSFPSRSALAAGLAVWLRRMPVTRGRRGGAHREGAPGFCACRHPRRGDRAMPRLAQVAGLGARTSFSLAAPFDAGRPGLAARTRRVCRNAQGGRRFRPPSCCGRTPVFSRPGHRTGQPHSRRPRHGRRLLVDAVVRLPGKRRRIAPRAYRALYYLLPWGAATLLLLRRAVHSKVAWAAPSRFFIAVWCSSPDASCWSVRDAGPRPPCHCPEANRTPAALETSHVATGIIGLFLFVLARGLRKGYRTAYRTTLALLLGGAVGSLSERPGLRRGDHPGAHGGSSLDTYEPVYCPQRQGRNDDRDPDPDRTGGLCLRRSRIHRVRRTPLSGSLLSQLWTPRLGCTIPAYVEHTAAPLDFARRDLPDSAESPSGMPLLPIRNCSAPWICWRSSGTGPMPSCPKP